jgi:hypothetical protein
VITVHSGRVVVKFVRATDVSECWKVGDDETIAPIALQGNESTIGQFRFINGQYVKIAPIMPEGRDDM